eukprot:SAG25_NODE_254_length_10958_cov_53.133622_10_plen_157_part_00
MGKGLPGGRRQAGNIDYRTEPNSSLPPDRPRRAWPRPPCARAHAPPGGRRRPPCPRGEIAPRTPHHGDPRRRPLPARAPPRRCPVAAAGAGARDSTFGLSEIAIYSSRQQPPSGAVTSSAPCSVSVTARKPGPTVREAPRPSSIDSLEPAPLASLL